MDSGTADERGRRLRDQARLLRRVTPGGPHLLGTQWPDVTAQCKGLDQEPDRIPKI